MLFYHCHCCYHLVSFWGYIFAIERSWSSDTRQSGEKTNKQTKHNNALKLFLIAIIFLIPLETKTNHWKSLLYLGFAIDWIHAKSGFRLMNLLPIEGKRASFQVGTGSRCNMICPTSQQNHLCRKKNVLATKHASTHTSGKTGMANFMSSILDIWNMLNTSVQL